MTHGSWLERTVYVKCRNELIDELNTNRFVWRSRGSGCNKTRLRQQGAAYVVTYYAISKGFRCSVSSGHKNISHTMYASPLWHCPRSAIIGTNNEYILLHFGRGFGDKCFMHKNTGSRLLSSDLRIRAGLWRQVLYAQERWQPSIVVRLMHKSSPAALVFSAAHLSPAF